LVGTPEQLIERLKDAESIGVAYAITYFADDAYDGANRELFEAKVIPELQ
jgi:hypothetical protein